MHITGYFSACGLGRPLKQILLFALALAGLQGIDAFASIDGLVLWNQLGSDTEVANSVVGPNLQKYTGGSGPDVAATTAYGPGFSGNAVTIAGTYQNMSRIHNLVLNNVQACISPERGTINVWLKQISDPVLYSKGYYRLFDGAFGLGSGVLFDCSPDGLRFGLTFGGTQTEVSSRIAAFNGTWINVAGVWDRAGIDGSADKLRLYVNGQVVGASSIAGWGYAVGTRADIAGGQDANSAGQFFEDELKIYNRALTTAEIVELYTGQPPTPVAPEITGQPVSQTVEAGTPAGLKVVATGTPLHYQWFFQGSALPGATASTLAFSAVDATNAGVYFVTVSNVAGVATSANAVLTVIPPPWQTNGGLVLWNQLGSNTEISNSVVGPNLQKYTGGSSPDVAATTAFGPGFSGNAVTIAGTYQNMSRVHNIILANVNRHLSPERGTINVWYKQISNPVFYSKGYYRLFDGAFGLGSGVLFDSSPDGLRFGLNFGGTQTEVRYKIAAFNGIWINVAGVWDRAGINGSADKLRLYVNGQVVGASTNGAWGSVVGTRADIAGGQDANSAGQFFEDELMIFNRALLPDELGNIYEGRNFGVVPRIVNVSPEKSRVNEGGSVAFSGVATGSPVLKYQWLHNGAVLPYATNAALSLSNVADSDAGTYALVVSNPFGSATSSEALLQINHAPVADASATTLVNISPNGSNAVVVLDGSRSSDIDGDTLTWNWFRTGEATAFASGAVAVVQLPLGAHSVTLEVQDGLSGSTAVVLVEVISTAEATDRLIELVKTGPGNHQPLLASLMAALAATDRDQPGTAINQLEAFISKVCAQLQDAPVLAAELISEAEKVLAALNGAATDTAAKPLVITSIRRSANGRPHLKIQGNSGRVHVLEASTNLLDWVPVGVAAQASDGSFEFEDSVSPKVSARFYRVYSPR